MPKLNYTALANEALVSDIAQYLCRGVNSKLAFRVRLMGRGFGTCRKTKKGDTPLFLRACEVSLPFVFLIDAYGMPLQ